MANRTLSKRAGRKTTSRSAFPPPIRLQLRDFKKLVRDIEGALSRQPDERDRFQARLNESIDGIFRHITGLASDGRMADLNRLKQHFVQHYRPLFSLGQLNRWALEKPYGYAGDFWVIDQIYQNHPSTHGLSRLLDNYSQMTAICKAVRNRKDDFKAIVRDFIVSCPEGPVSIMDLACGPARELFELASDPDLCNRQIEVDCYDNDSRSLAYASQLLDGICLKTKFIQANALRIAAAADVSRVIGKKYDIIYSTGLFDYLNAKITVRLLRNLYSCLKPGGMLAVSDVRGKQANPSAYYMEWVSEWELLYNSDEEFRSHCHDAGIDHAGVSYQYEKQGIFQYVIARR